MNDSTLSSRFVESFDESANIIEDASAQRLIQKFQTKNSRDLRDLNQVVWDGFPNPISQ